MIPLETERLIIRNWRDNDLDRFHEINSDPQVMEFFPFRRDRSQAAELMARLQREIAANGYGFAALELKSKGQCIGFCGLEDTALPSVFEPGTIEIGWRLARPFWGRGYITESARKWLDFGFRDLALDEIISMAVRDNRRSIAVMQRLNMLRRPERDFDHPSVPDTHLHLRAHVVYTISRGEWAEESASPA